MSNHGYQNYFDNEVLAASPLKLIGMLYSGALDSLADARRHLRDGDIRARTKAINRGIRIVSELSQSLNHQADGILSRNLAGIYGYVMRLLIEANLKQVDGPLAEGEGLLSTLAEAWKSCIPVPTEPISPVRATPSQDVQTSGYSAVRARRTIP